ncbi:Vms1/Ankzf1 family peptidyl-tRNA hydrolase [Lentzea sp. NPDC005914]|uniref:baeRF2 domain-containing protein n=1 Tax=Lentzea sp. NPDC005914 TaxID=3154572 RepID=UPI0034012F79
MTVGDDRLDGQNLHPPTLDGHLTIAVPPSLVEAALQARPQSCANTTARRASSPRGRCTRSAVGGWAHKQLQQRVEDTVKHNVKQVAEEVERLVREVRAKLVVLAI